MSRKTMGINVVRHEQMRHQKGGILPMGAAWPATPLLPMQYPKRSLFDWIWR